MIFILVLIYVALAWGLSLSFLIKGFKENDRFMKMEGIFTLIVMTLFFIFYWFIK